LGWSSRETSKEETLMSHRLPVVIAASIFGVILGLLAGSTTLAVLLAFGFGAAVAIIKSVR